MLIRSQSKVHMPCIHVIETYVHEYPPFVVLFNIIHVHVVRVVRLKMHVTHCTSLHHMSDVLFYKQESRFKSLSYLLLFHFLSSS